MVVIVNDQLLHRLRILIRSVTADNEQQQSDSLKAKADDTKAHVVTWPN